MRAHSKMLIGASAALVMSLAGTAQGQTGGPGYIVNSDHNLGSFGWANNEICLPCHAPHNTSTEVQNVPMWNHAVSTAARYHASFRSSRLRHA